MIKILKGIGIAICIVCVLFTAFFFYSYASGNTTAISQVEAVTAKLGGQSDKLSEQSTVSMFAKNFGLTTTQAAQLANAAEQLGVDTGDPAAVASFIAKNVSNTDNIKTIVEALQSGAINASQALSRLKGILNV